MEKKEKYHIQHLLSRCDSAGSRKDSQHDFFSCSIPALSFFTPRGTPNLSTPLLPCLRSPLSAKLGAPEMPSRRDTATHTHGLVGTGGDDGGDAHFRIILRTAFLEIPNILL